MNCLDNIIGLSETICECYDNGKPSDFNVSKSGIFLDQLEGFELPVVQGVADCAKGGLWDIMSIARRNATTQFTSDMLSCVQQNYKATPGWAGVLGNITYNGVVNPQTNYAGVKTYPMNRKGAYMYIRKIGVLVNATTNVTVKIYSNEDGGTLIAQYTIAADANVVTYAEISPAPLELKLWSYNILLIKYYAVMELNGTFLPLNNKKDCNCGGERPWLSWTDFFGVKGNQPTGGNIDGSFMQTNDKTINGVLLDVEFKCRTNEIICSDEYPLDFANDGYAKNIAYAIRFKTAEIAYINALSTTNINRPTLMNREGMLNLAQGWRNEYNKWIDFLCTNVRLGANHCLICKDSPEIRKGHIQV